MTRIMQENHKLYTVEVEKKSLSPFNDKKWVSREGDNFISYSYGHYKIAECGLWISKFDILLNVENMSIL